MRTGCDAYQKVNTLGMSQLDLILAVYRGAIRFLEQAKTAFQQDKGEGGRTACEKARKCLVHLYSTLDMDKGQEIAQYLARLYAYAIEQIDLAAASRAIDRIDDIIGVINNLKEGWESLKEKKAPEPVLCPPDQPTAETNAIGQVGKTPMPFVESRVTYSA